MGFLSKMKNNLMGSWADVTLTVTGTPTRGAALTVHVDVAVKSEAIEVTSVLVEVSCDEVIEVHQAMVKAGNSRTIDTGYAERITEELTRQEVILASATTLAAESTTGYDGQITLPLEAPPTVHGRYAQFTWTIRARLDMKGNDPDSGWQTLDVRS